MGVTARQLNRATLARQMLLERQPVSPADAMRRVVAVQAQDPAAPYVALWNRIAEFQPADLDAAFNSHILVKAPLMRITLHAVAIEDYPTFHEAMLPILRAARLNDRRFRAAGMSIADADALIARLVEFTAAPRTKSDIDQMLEDHLGVAPQRGLWWALRTYAPLIHSPTGAPWSFGAQPSYLAAPTTQARPDPDRALRGLIRRYLEGFGPATANDVAQFTLQKRTTARDTLRAMTDHLTVTDGPDGAQLFDVPDGGVPDGDTPAPPRLMAMWDSTLLAYSDRSRIIPPQYRPLVTRRNGDVLPTLLVDGHVAGVWRPVDAGIEAAAFHPLPSDAWDGLAAEARQLTPLLTDRDPSTFSRYGHWWSTLPDQHIQLLPS